MVYIKDHGYVDTPSKPEQFKLIKGVPSALSIAKKLDYKIIIISNQPGIAKGYYTKKTFDEITRKMRRLLKNNNIILDDEYYCFHHPNAKLRKYKKKCSCRKPKIGLFNMAIKKYDLDIANSYFIGDGIVDMEAAKKVGCRSIFIGNVNSTITELFERKKIEPNHVASNLLEAINIITTKQ
jgi:D-glycero-D-manno-heptose 1,7-bisphosphate phosphatase